MNGGDRATNASLRRLLALLVVVVVAAGSVVALLTLNPGAVPIPSGSGGPATTTPPGRQPPPPPTGLTFRDFAVDPTIVRSPTNSAAQSKLWYADGLWWGALFGPTTNRLGIFRLDPRTQVWADTGALVDERAFADADMLWTGDNLYAIAGGGRRSDNHAIRLRRYTYDAEAQRFNLDSNFPVTIRPLGGSPPVIAVDSAGTVWATFVADGRVWLTHTLEHDAAWSEPFALETPEARVDAVDVSSIVAFGPGRLGVIWTNQRSGVYFSLHEDGAPATEWSPPEAVLEGGLPDDSVSLTTMPLPDGGTTVAAAVSTTLDDGTGSRSLDPLTLLATRGADGAWDSTLVGLVRDRHARPIVMVDPIAETVAVAATSPGTGGAIYYKRSPIDPIQFDTGVGVPLVSSPSETTLDNVTSSKGPLTERAGMLVLASDRTTGRYVHGFVDLGGGPPEADPADPQRPTLPLPAPAGTKATYLRDSFETWALGPLDPAAGWYVRAQDPQDALTIVPDLGVGKALGVPSSVTGVRACRDFPEVPGTTLTIQLRIRVSRVGSSDATIMSMRGTGGEAASLRVTDRGTFAWFDRATKLRSSALLRPGAWYRVVAVIDQPNRTYSVRVTTDGGAHVAAGRGLRWRMPGVETVRTLCVETAGGAPEQTIAVADATVLLHNEP